MRSLTRRAQLLDVKLKKSNLNTIKTWRNTCDMSLWQQLKIKQHAQNKTQWCRQHHTNITYYRNILCMHVYVPMAQSTADLISDMSRSGQKNHAQQMWRESDLTEFHRQALFWPPHERGKFFTLKHKQLSKIYYLAVKQSHFHKICKQDMLHNETATNRRINL